MTKQTTVATNAGREVPGQYQMLWSQAWIRREAYAQLSSARRPKKRIGLQTIHKKLVGPEQLRAQAVRSMAESVKRKCHALKDRNTIAELSREDANGLSQTTRLFRALRKNYINQALKRAWIVLQDLYFKLAESSSENSCVGSF